MDDTGTPADGPAGSAAQHAGLHRPAVRMNWVNLLFLHWRVDAAAVRNLVPRELEIDTFDGSAWVGLVPFRMEASRFAGVPRLPGLQDFYECNVRTYVRYRGRSGVWFLSLDAERLLPVLGGRWLWSLNYIHSRFRVERSLDGSHTDYRVRRRRGPWPAAKTHVVWRSGESLPPATVGSIEHFLTERYWLFTRRRGRVLGGEVLHRSWPLRQATVEHLDDGLVAAAGLHVSGLPLVWASDLLKVEGAALRELPPG